MDVGWEKGRRRREKGKMRKETFAQNTKKKGRVAINEEPKKKAISG